MPYKLVFHPEVKIELEQIITYYEQISNKLAIDFETELLQCYERITTNPLHYFTLHKSLKIRRALLKRFPYKIIFKVQKNKTVFILAFTHHKRRSYWKKRS